MSILFSLPRLLWSVVLWNVLVLLSLPLQSSGQSADDGFNPGADGPVSALAVQADGKVVVGGNFSTLGGQARSNIGRLNPDGSVDATFNPGANNGVSALAVQADGKIVVGGNFSTLGGQARSNIGRLNPDGSVEATFNPGADNTVNALAVQADGKVVVGGLFTMLGGQARNYLGRLNSDGSVEATFNPGADNTVNALAIQAGGKLVVGGDFTILGGQARSNIGRLNPDGSVEATFNPGANNGVSALAVLADGKVVVGGDFSTLGGQARNRIGRLNPDGSVEATFNPGANNGVSALAVLADGKVVVGGDFSTLGGQARNRIGRLNPDGSVDATFNPGANNGVSALAVQADGKVVVGGFFSTLGGQTRSNIGRLNPDGSVEATFNPGADNSVLALAVQADGKVVVGGDFSTLGGQARSRIGRLNPDGSVDATFNPGADDSVFALAVQADGKVVVGGLFNTLGGQARSRIGRLNPDGSVDVTFNPGTNGDVFALALQADGRIVVGGLFSTLGGQARTNIGRLFPDGNVDTLLNPGTSDGVLALAVQADGKVVVGGLFTVLGGQTRVRIGRLNPNGSVESTFNPGTLGGDVNVLAVQVDGKVVVGGGFTTLGGQPRRRIGRLNSDGSVDTTFNPVADGAVNALVVQADGKMLVGGGFTALGGQPRSRIGQLNPDGSLNATFNVAVDFVINALAVQGDGKMVVGGDFTLMGGQPRLKIGRLSSPTATVQDLQVAADGTTVTWLRGGNSPEVWNVTIEHSLDGVTWSGLEAATRIAGGWQLTGVSLPTSGLPVYVRARGFAASGQFNGSASVYESVRLVFIAPDMTTSLSGFPAGVGAGSMVSGSVSYENVGEGTAQGVQYGLTLAAGLSGMTVSCTNGVTGSYASGTGIVTLSGPSSVPPGGNFTCLVSYTAPGGGNVVVTSTVSTTTSQGANPAPDSAEVTTVIAPVAGISDVSQLEGDSGTTAFTFTVTLSGTAVAPVTVVYGTANRTATAGSDYTAVPATVLTFDPGETSKPVTVNVTGDHAVELDETFEVNLSNASGVTIADSQGVATIINDDSTAVSISNVTENEGNSGTTVFSFGVTLSNPSASPVTVAYATADRTATAGSDYTAVPATVLTFNPGETSKLAPVNVTGDTVGELDETFEVNLTNASGATIADGQGIGAILNDDPHTLVITVPPSGTPNPVAAGGMVLMSVTAVDSFAHGLSYSWSADCPPALVTDGSFNNATLRTPTWTAPVNTSGTLQQCTVSVQVTDGGGGLSQSASYQQQISLCNWTLSPPNRAMGAASGSGNTVTVTAANGCAWTATSQATWVTISNGQTGNGTGTVTYNVEANPGPNPRRGLLTIAGKTFIVSQDTPVPASCTIDVSAPGGPIAAGGGTGNIAITASTASCSWRAQSHVPWITLTTPVSGQGSGTVAYSVAANTGGQRAGRITVNGKRFTVTQN